MSPGTRILVRAPNWLGDLVMSTPGFRALRTAHPDAHITLHVRGGLAPLLSGSPWFDDVLPVASYHRGRLALWREARSLRDRAFDVGLCVPESFSSALLMRAAGVGHVVGYGGGGRSFLLHQAVPSDPAWGARRMVARERFVLKLVEAMGCPPCGTHLELHTTEAAEAAVDELLAGEDGPLVVLAPGASYGSSKCWPTESFAAVADSLAAEGARIVLVGAPAELLRSRRVARAARASLRDLTGRLGLGELKALLRRARLVVCNDAGARHVAVAFGVPAIVLFGPTSLAKTNMNLERVVALSEDVDCRPCYARECPIDHRCMTRIAPARVVEHARKLLARVPA